MIQKSKPKSRDFPHCGDFHKWRFSCRIQTRLFNWMSTFWHNAKTQAMIFVMIEHVFDVNRSTTSMDFSGFSRVCHNTWTLHQAYIHQFFDNLAVIFQNWFTTRAFSVAFLAVLTNQMLLLAPIPMTFSWCGTTFTNLANQIVSYFRHSFAWIFKKRGHLEVVCFQKLKFCKNWEGVFALNIEWKITQPLTQKLKFSKF